MEGVTTAIVAFVFVCIIFPHIIKNRPQYYAAVALVLLSILDEQPREKVAETLGISQGYLRVLLHRAREHVRNCPFVFDSDLPEVE